MFPLIAFAFAFAFAFASASVTNCAPKSTFQITKLALDPPSTVSVGQNVSLLLLYTTPVEIDSGTITTSVTYNYLPFTPTVAPLCETAPCPITIGEHDGSSWFVMTSGVKGNVVTKIMWQAQGIDLLCLNINLNIN